MKNLSGKTLIFYTFQQKKELEYNIIAYPTPQQPILIKDVIAQLPLDLASGRFHFRFKSEFSEGNQKISGWIDITNLAAKVPLVGGSIYVKILKVKSNAHNKIFNVQKLGRVGLVHSSTDNINQLKSAKSTQQSIHQLKAVSPVISISSKKQQKHAVKRLAQTKIQQIDLMQDHSNSNKAKKQSKPIIQTNIQMKVKIEVSEQSMGSDLFQFEKQKVFKNQETTEQKVKFFKETMQAEEQQKQNERIARDELQDKINKWGYSGSKTINNLTTLLATLHDIWPQWPSISLTELLKPQSLAAHTKKALIKTHPDKNRNKPFKEKYLSKRVFELLNEAKKAAAN